VNIESGSADCFVASAVRFPRKTIEKEAGYSTFLVWRGYDEVVLDEAVRGGEAKNAPARHALRNGTWHRFISSICSAIFRSLRYIQRHERFGYCAKLLRRLACCANLIALSPVEKVDQIMLRSAPHEYSVNRGNVTVILVGEFRVVVHADRVPVSQ
jgi:hypothetical protein